jgi:hypothetical protein
MFYQIDINPFIYTLDEKYARPLQLRVEEFYLFCLLLWLCSLSLPPCLFVFTPRDYPHPTPMATGPFVLVLRSFMLEFFLLFVRVLFD